MDSLSPADSGRRMQKGNFFNFDDDLESQVMSDELQDLTAKEFVSSSTGQQMKDNLFTVQEDDSTVKIGTPLYQSEEKQNIQIYESNPSSLSVKYTAIDAEKSIDLETTESVEENTDSLLQPADIIRDIFLGKHTWIGRFRKLSKKRELLVLSLETYDQNTIFSVLWYLKQTLTNEVLFDTLKEIPSSKIHYYTLLQKKGLEQELIATTHACRDYEKCGLLKLKQARRSADPYKQILMMKDSESYFKKFGLTRLGEFVADECELLDSQISIHRYEKSIGAVQEGIGGIEIFSPVLRTPNYTTLYYLCLQHFNSNSELSSPTNFQSRFNITNAQFIWIALSARAQLKDWPCVEVILKKYQTKSWFGISKTSTFVISPEKIVEIFHEKDPAPWGEVGRELRDNLLVSLLNQIENLEDKYLWSFNFLCHPVVIDTLAKLKAKKRLEDYVDKVPPFSKFRRQIGDKLASKTILWNEN